jgi:hypothetical protein
VPREHHQDFLRSPTLIGYDCIKAIMNKLRTRNTTWDHDLYTLIQKELEEIKPATLSLMELQRIVADQILAFVTMKNSFETAAPAQQNVKTTTADYGTSTSKMSQVHNVGVNAIAQESNTYSGTIRKDSSKK